MVIVYRDIKRLYRIVIENESKHCTGGYASWEETEEGARDVCHKVIEWTERDGGATVTKAVIYRVCQECDGRGKVQGKTRRVGCKPCGKTGLLDKIYELQTEQKAEAPR